MARTSTSVGVGITIVLLGVLLLATFILSIVFYGQKQRAEKELEALDSQITEFIRTSERNADDVQRLLNEAQQQRSSLVGYLIDSVDTTSRRITGRQFSTLENVNSRIRETLGENPAPLLRAVEERNQEIATLQRRLSENSDALAQARADLQAEVSRMEEIESGYAATLESLNQELAVYKDEVDGYRSQVGQTIDRNNERVEQIRSDAAEVESSLRARISDQQEQILLLQDQIAELKGSESEKRLTPRDEYALVDARVVGTEPAERQVFLDIGRAEHVILGMTFEVYSDAAAIRPDDAGNYPSGKATVEIIRIDENSSVGRIVRENRGNPVVSGDVVANAVYDPEKTYTFVVFGNFDSNRDGVATPQERNSIEGLIDDWGGQIVDDISGSTDFLVLGERPLLPPPPPSDAPIEIIQSYLQKQREVQRYDDLFESARQASIPVLNENRLYTLTGMLSRS